MLSVADIRAYFKLLPHQKIVSYFHETQFSYPLKKGENFDIQYGLNDISTAMASDFCLFNSNYHKNQFLKDIKFYLKKMPDFQPLWIKDQINQKSSVIYPCCELSTTVFIKPTNTPLKILYNHRWEHDKNPEEFFNSIFKLSQEGFNFDLYILGESYKNIPEIFSKAQTILQKHIKQFGYVKSLDNYYSILKQCDFVVSTSLQENYGISVIEAMNYGCIGLLPDRLSYPELLPTHLKSKFIYSDLYIALKEMFKMSNIKKSKYSNSFIEAMQKYSTKNLVNELDNFFEKIKL
ncbi:MAG: hypothetical protein COB02_15265 [Candidatus Cloacimonadota bacterium]|nr:MAG: hypothetical protein COB02_15265 [Candidatus Cloacimonadota bacterium]